MKLSVVWMLNVQLLYFVLVVGAAFFKAIVDDRDQIANRLRYARYVMRAVFGRYAE